MAVALKYDIKTDDERALKDIAEASQKGCYEHFETGTRRLKKHPHLVPPEHFALFDAHLKALFAASDVPMFKKECAAMLRTFPNIDGWLSWWMRPRQARMLFPAYRTMDEQQWNSTPNTTNAEESLHYRYYLAAGLKRVSVMEGMDALWKLALYYEDIHQAARGMFLVLLSPAPEA